MRLPLLTPADLSSEQKELYDDMVDVIDNSFGELVALHAAGVLSETELLQVARRRGELMADAAAMPGAMTALALPIEQVRELIARAKSPVVVANHNAPQQVVVSGALQAIVDFEMGLYTAQSFDADAKTLTAEGRLRFAEEP